MLSSKFIEGLELFAYWKKKERKKTVTVRYSALQICFPITDS